MTLADNNQFWRNKKVFLTGHTGFKGSWLSIWLHYLGAEVKGYALAPNTSPAMFTHLALEQYVDSEIGNICDFDQLKQSMCEFEPDVLIHMAAQPLVRASYKDPVTTYATNVMGLVNVLEAARSCEQLKAIVNVTSDKCYENQEWSWGYREVDPMGGFDPYSSSKGCAELVTQAYRRSFYHPNQPIALASARAGNVIGGGDWAEDRLIPDILRALSQQKTVSIRQPKAIRPWQHVLEPLSGYLILAQRLYESGHDFAQGWNFGPYDQDVKTVAWIANFMTNRWGQNASWEIEGESQLHEAHRLKLDITKASERLDWEPCWSIEQALQAVCEWHQAWIEKEDMLALTIKQIEAYEAVRSTKQEERIYEY